MPLKNVRLRCSSRLAPPDVEVCSLTVLEKEDSDRHRSRLLTGAIVGDGAWKASSLNWLDATTVYDCQDVLIGQLSEGLLEVLRDVFNPRMTEDLVRLYKLDLELLIQQELANQGFVLPMLIIRGYFVNNPDLESLTWNEKQQCHVGLHIDRIEGASSVCPINRLPRICVNLGQENRYFLFADVTSTQVADLRGLEDTNLTTSDHSQLLSYCRLQRDLKVYRIALRPGCFYVANTEHLVHDGSNSGSRKPDEQLVLLSADAMLSLLKAH